MTEPKAIAMATDNSWPAHIRATLALGLPLIGAQLAQLFINTTDILIIGRLGTAELAAMVLAGQFFFTIFIFGSGLSAAVVPIAAQAFSQGDVVSVRRSVRMGLWAALAYAVLTLFLMFNAEAILLAAGQKPEVARLAGDYLFINGWSLFPALVFMVLRSFLSAVGRAGFILYVTLIILVVNAVFAYGLVLGRLGMPQLGFNGAAWVSLGVNLLSVLLTIAYIQWRKDLRSYELFVRFWRPEWRMLREVIVLGVPISLMILAEVSLFTVASLLMGWIGTVELAAHGIALQLASVAFMIPLGLSQAATVRVGQAAGINDRLGMVRASWAVLGLAVSVALIGSLLYAVLPGFWANLFLDRTKPNADLVLDFAARLVIIAGLFQMVDGLQVIATGMLRGIKDTRVPMIIAIISYWPVGFLLAYVLAFPLGMGGIGVWIGFLVGLATAAVLLLWRYAALIRKIGVHA